MMKHDRPQVVLVNRCIVRNSSNDILLVKRSVNDSYNPGKWEFPGGKLDIGQDLSNALEREVMEETGLLIEPESKLNFAESYIIGNEGQYMGFTYVALFGIAHSIGGKLKLSDEHDDYAWEDYDTALEYDLTIESRKALIVLTKTVLKEPSSI